MKKKTKKQHKPKGSCRYCAVWNSARRRKKDLERNSVLRYCERMSEWTYPTDVCKDFYPHKFIICPVINGSRYYSACIRKIDKIVCKKCSVGKMIRYFMPLKRFKRRKMDNI